MFEALTKDFVTPYITSTGKRHTNYNRCVDVAHHVSFHFDGYQMKPFNADKKGIIGIEGEAIEKVNPYFTWLIDNARPSESQVIQMYRRKTYLPKSKNPIQKVYNILRKILKSSDWAISYPQEHTTGKDGATTVPLTGGLEGDDTLEAYCEENFPAFDSIENWFYQVGLRRMLIDPNALVAVLPMEWAVEQSEWLRPFPYIIDSKDVYEFDEGDHAIFKSPNLHTWQDSAGKTRKTIKIVFIDAESCWEVYKQEEQIRIDEVWKHGMSELPIYQLGGEIATYNGKNTVYESFLEPMLPDLDDMSLQASDFQGAVIQHLHPTMWYYAMQDCKNCEGMGYVNVRGKRTVCSSCGGDGGIAFSPFKHMKMRPPDRLKGDAIQGEPAGYINKPIDVLELMEKRIDRTGDQSLAAVNMEFLSKEPVTSSGVSKAYDQDAAHAYIYKVAYHIVTNVFNPLYYFIAKERYGLHIADNEKRDAMLPSINIPEKFDFVTEAMILAELNQLQTAKADPEIIAQAEIDYVAKKYYNSPEVKSKLLLKRQHDPFPNMTTEDKIAVGSSGMVRKVDMILSLNIDDITEGLMNEVKDLFKMKYAEVKELMYEKAQEIMDSLDEAKQVKQMASMYQLDDDGNPLKDAEGNLVMKNGQVAQPPPAGGATDPAAVGTKLKNKKTGNTPADKTTGLKYA